MYDSKKKSRGPRTPVGGPRPAKAATLQAPTGASGSDPLTDAAVRDFQRRKRLALIDALDALIELTRVVAVPGVFAELREQVTKERRPIQLSPLPPWADLGVRLLLGMGELEPEIAVELVSSTTLPIVRAYLDVGAAEATAPSRSPESLAEAVQPIRAALLACGLDGSNLSDHDLLGECHRARCCWKQTATQVKQMAQRPAHRPVAQADRIFLERIRAAFQRAGLGAPIPDDLADLALAIGFGGGDRQEETRLWKSRLRQWPSGN